MQDVSASASISLQQVEAGRDVSIHVGLAGTELAAVVDAAVRPWRQLTDEQKATIERLERQLGANREQVLTFLQIAGEAEVEPERISVKLVEIAHHYRSLQAQLATLPGHDPAIVTLRRAVEEALGRGDLDRTDALLRDMQSQQDKAAEQEALQAASIRAQRAAVALTRLRYLEAADLFAEAAKRVPAGCESERGFHLEQEILTYFRQGEEFGDNVALATAIERLRTLVRLRPRERAVVEWAMTQVSLGAALATLGEREETGAGRLEEAAAIYRTVLEELSRELAPREWARALTNLGSVLMSLGLREAGTKRLEEAVGIFHVVLGGLAREQAPLEWARAQASLGLALEIFGERETGNARLEEAIAAFRAAFKIISQNQAPLEWAKVRVNFANTLKLLGEREPGTERLEEAIAAYKSVLEVRTRSRVPRGWAMVQLNLGSALLTLGEREKSRNRLDEAAVVFRASLTELTRERDAFAWAKLQNNLGSTFLSIDKIEREAAHQKLIGKAILAVIEQRAWSGMLEGRDDGEARMKEAISCFSAALEVLTREQSPLEWARIKSNLAEALIRLSLWEGAGTVRLEEAVAACASALEVSESVEAAQYTLHAQEIHGWAAETLRPRRGNL